MATDKSYEFLETALTTKGNGIRSFHLTQGAYDNFMKWCNEQERDELLELLQHQEQPDGRIKIWL